MRHRNLIRRSNRRPRGGIAPLEFVMALPLLFLLFICITWLGFSVIGQTEVLIEARNKAWKRRFEDASKKPLVFTRLPTYDEGADYVTEKASKRVQISPVFDRVPGPEASHTILAGSWDHEAMSFKEPPDLKLMAVAATIGTFGEAINWAAVLDDPIGALTKAGGGIKNQAENEAANVGKGDPDSGSTSGSSPGADSDTKTPEEAKQDTEQQRLAKKAELEQRYKALGGRLNPFRDVVEPVGGELKETNDEIVRLQAERAEKFLAASSEQDQEKKKQLQEEVARIGRQIDLTTIKYKRLEAELRDVVAELEALGVSRTELWYQR